MNEEIINEKSDEQVEEEYFYCKFDGATRVEDCKCEDNQYTGDEH